MARLPPNVVNAVLGAVAKRGVPAENHETCLAFHRHWTGRVDDLLAELEEDIALSNCNLKS